MTHADPLPKHHETGDKIRAARVRKGISQENLAPIVGTTRRHLIRLERGLHRPSDDLLARIAEATGQPLDFFRPEPRRDVAAASIAGNSAPHDREGVHVDAA